MKIFRAFLATLPLVLIALFYFGLRDSSGHYRVLEVRDMSYITLDRLVGDVKQADLVFVGEQHSIMAHHIAQLEIIKALRHSGANVALGLEIFKADQQAALDGWSKGEMPIEEFRRIYEEYWGLPWYLYADIFLYARDEGIPLVGLNIPQRITRKVSEKGFSSLTQEDLKELPIGLTCDVDEEYMAFIRTINRAHGRSGEGFLYFCEAQLLWDKVMAYHLVQYLDKNPGTKAVVLSGIVHSWKKGIPERIRRTSDFTSKVILPLTDDTLPETMNTEYLDYFLE